MKASILLITFFIIAIGGGSSLFYYQQKLPDVANINIDLNQYLLDIDRLDVEINQLLLRNRVNLDTSYDALVSAMLDLDLVLKQLDTHYLTDNEELVYSLMDSDLAISIKKFKDTYESKKYFIEHFKSHNAILRNSEKYSPVVGLQLANIAAAEGLLAIEKRYINLVLELSFYIQQGYSSEKRTILNLLKQLRVSEESMPATALTQIIEFNNHVSTVIEEKSKTDQYLDKAFTSRTQQDLQVIRNEWDEILILLSKEQREFRDLSLGYIVMLLLFTGLIAFKLRSLYRSLDSEVVSRTEEVKKANNDLVTSERQLIQVEKMSALGQLVTGITHEINTPLGYLMSNLNVLNSNMDQVGGLLDAVELLSREVKRDEPDRKKISLYLKHIVMNYNSLEKMDTLMEVRELLQDSLYGAGEISKLVTSLKEFSRLDKNLSESADVHKGLDVTIEICGHAIGQRQLIKKYADNLPHISCMPAQINQVLMNVLSNAAQATDEEEGVIDILTRYDEDNIYMDIKDNGCGMDEQTQKSMFDPFFTTKGVNQGAGLGMSIAYKIMQSHGGEILISSELNKGTKVTLVLPLRPLAS